MEEAISLLERLISFDTESSKSNLGIIEFIEEYLRAHNVSFVRVPNATGDKAALFATIGPIRDGGVVLSGHRCCAGRGAELELRSIHLAPRGR